MDLAHDEAILHFQKFLKLCSDRGEKDRAEGHYNLGDALRQKGQIGEAIAHYREAVKLRSDHAEAQNNLASVLLQEGLVDEAILHFEKALELRPDREKAHYNLGNALLRKEKVEEAIAHYEKALQIDPRSISTLNQLALVLATIRSINSPTRQSNRIGTASRSTFGRQKSDHSSYIGCRLC